MINAYYKIPIDFVALMDEKSGEKVSIDESISQCIFMISTTPLGRCKFDEMFGTEIPEVDFDLPRSNNSIKEFISKSITKAIIQYEKRLLLEDIEVTVENTDMGKIGNRRVKKKVSVSIKAYVIETDRPFFFHRSFFIGPLSH